jgi:acetoin utilization deacetylase AcuC-like enzyme
MDIYYSDHFVLPLPDGHRFPMQKYALLREAIAPFLAPGVLCEAPAATAAQLMLAHDPCYVEAVLNGTLSARQQREIGFPWSPQMAERARRSVGATLAACQSALRDGASASLCRARRRLLRVQ